jgi:hypothetical protein
MLGRSRQQLWVLAQIGVLAQFWVVAVGWGLVAIAPANNVGS